MIYAYEGSEVQEEDGFFSYLHPGDALVLEERKPLVLKEGGPLLVGIFIPHQP